MSACHAGDPGSIPGECTLFFFCFLLPRLWFLVPYCSGFGPPQANKNRQFHYLILSTRLARQAVSSAGPKTPLLGDELVRLTAGTTKISSISFAEQFGQPIFICDAIG
jgi:hypothetical protein